MISTKGRYSIRVLLDLAEHRSGDFIPMKEVAARQDISLKYIERLMPALKAAGLVESVHGIGGGRRTTPSGRYWSWRRAIWRPSPVSSRTRRCASGRGSAGRWACGRDTTS